MACFTYEATSKFLTNALATAFGQLHQERKNLQSTKISYVNFFLPSENLNKKTHNFFLQLAPFQAIAKVYGDLAGYYPYLSLRGDQHF